MGRSASEVFDSDIIVSSLVSGEPSESTGSSGEIPVKNFCYVIKPADGGDPSGVVYVRADLSSIESFMARSRLICVRAIAVALLVTVFLSFLLARSITEPINDVTETVVRMSEGDFDIEVPVKSDDEIGRLAEMFNILREKLDETITEINGDIVYHYAQTILAERDLRKAEIALEGEIYKEDRIIYDIPRSEPLTFYISTLTSLCDADRTWYTPDSTQIDTTYRRGVRALLERDYKTAVALLKPYRDYNSAVALSALDYNATALDVLQGCEPLPKVDYLRAILHARRGEDREAVECYMRACARERSFVHRGNLDPEIAGLIKLYNLKL